MTAEQPAPAVYLLVDRRRDGKMRILGEFVDPQTALYHARLLRWAGSPAQVLLASTHSDDA